MGNNRTTREAVSALSPEQYRVAQRMVRNFLEPGSTLRTRNRGGAVSLTPTSL